MIQYCGIYTWALLSHFYNRISTIEKSKLMFLHKLVSLPSDCIAKQPFLRIYYTFLANQWSISYWLTPYICGILKIYYIATSSLRSLFVVHIQLYVYFTDEKDMENIVKNAIIISETSQLNNRTSIDNKFPFCQKCASCHQHNYYVYYIIYKENVLVCVHTLIMTVLANICCRVPYIEVAICPYCGDETYEELMQCTLLKLGMEYKLV